MILIVCDVCGTSPAKIVAILNDGYARIPGTITINEQQRDIALKVTSIDLCDEHLPQEDDFQPTDCDIVFHWPDNQVPLLSIGVPPPTRPLGRVIEEGKGNE